MATITLTVPDAVVPRVRAAFTSHYGYTAELAAGTIPSDTTPGQYIEICLRRHIKQIVKLYETSQAAATAAATAETSVDTDIVIT